ncbi:MAG: c-type cytochrome [Bacteroidetes bacterium]|nr:c-type cytochrome [Bacteroidota bacterium]MBS1973699.1 c-type cytochrome [Bacteroidota bacterium]
MKKLFSSRVWILISTIIFVVIVDRIFTKKNEPKKIALPAIISGIWSAPDTNSIPHTKEGEMVLYGRALIANTAFYLGPKGKISHSTNGMNCQNCHLDAGTKPWGNNYSAVFSTYPKYRERLGAVETIEQRVNDCLERSLNGKALDSNSKEMKAILAYMKWLGQNVLKGQKPKGAGILQLVFLERAADTGKGKSVFGNKCAKCHQLTGQGQLNADGITFLYPPLWGAQSFTDGAGLHRLSRFAGYVKDNMPFGANYKAPQLTDEEAWDVAAYVNSQPRPHKTFSGDWPNISQKPFDQPFGPYADSFSAQQHKYGPFSPIQKAKQGMAKNKLF